MRQQKYYTFFQQQILVMIALSLIPGVVYLFAGWIFGIMMPALIWYALMLLVSLYGWKLYTQFQSLKMNEATLKHWYDGVRVFMYSIFALWTVVFLLYVGKSEYDLHYIAIFTQIGASVVASALLVSDKKIFVPILFTMILPLAGYFFLIGTWYGYILSSFSLVLLIVLLYASNNTYTLLQKNYYQANQDELTGLYNRRYFLDYMDELLKRVYETGETVHIYLIDLDYFKTINDSLGHDIGDELLIAVSKRIKLFSQDTHVLARLGGDEFVLVSKESCSEEDAYDFALRLLDNIREPYIVDQHHLYVSASIGVHQIHPDSLDSMTLLKNVDIAMYDAKTKGRDTVMLFDESLSYEINEHLMIEQKLHSALKHHQLDVYYQPQFDSTRQMIGCEVLIRWEDKSFGVIAPDVFIPIAEKTGLIIDLGSYVMNEMFQTLHDWNVRGVALKHVSVNVSIKQLLHYSFVKEVEALLQMYQLQSSDQKIVFEITESIFARDVHNVLEIMHKLRKLGIFFSIDDFGTGYSSLSYLNTLPVTELKIDRSFIEQSGKDESNRNMIKTIISIAKNFDLTIVAEGVETEEQFDFLSANGCDLYQGFYFGNVIPKGEFEENYLLN
ncbi:MAG TPA: EAL domain-containing protein [Sulfurovum sp.]|uniref:putative bifunctional diguanylate cyclase/phosphodiesterase n=1 Tax=Sulfurovum sp. TaxID=1969726 RepID=UPI002F94556C